MGDRLGLGAIAGAVQFLARAKKRQRLQRLGTGLKKFAMQLAERLRIFDRDFGRELAAAFAGADFLAARTAVHVTASFQFDEITAVAEDDAFIQPGSNGFHGMVCVPGEDVVDGAGGRVSQESAATDAKARKIPTASRGPTFSLRKRIAMGTLTTG